MGNASFLISYSHLGSRCFNLIVQKPLIYKLRNKHISPRAEVTKAKRRLFQLSIAEQFK